MRDTVKADTVKADTVKANTVKANTVKAVILAVKVGDGPHDTRETHMAVLA